MPRGHSPGRASLRGNWWWIQSIANQSRERFAVSGKTTENRPARSSRLIASARVLGYRRPHRIRESGNPLATIWQRPARSEHSIPTTQASFHVGWPISRQVDPGQTALASEIDHCFMIRLRRRLRVRIALLAMVLLLWSQFVLAGHAGCLMEAPAAQTGLAAMDNCDGEMPPPAPVCAAHCSDGEATAESSRIPAVPPMLAAPAIPLTSIAAIANEIYGGVPCIGLPPPPSWHRPTGHPAALLLI